MSFQLLYLSFHLDSLHHHPDSPYFLHFHHDSSHSYTDSLHLHLHAILWIPTLILCTSLISFQFSLLTFTDSLLSLQSLRIYFTEIVALVQKRMPPLLLLHNPWHQIIIYKIYDDNSVINKNYLL